MRLPDVKRRSSSYAKHRSSSSFIACRNVPMCAIRRLTRAQGPRMRRQQHRRGGGGGGSNGGFGGAWAGWDGDAGAQRGGGSGGSGSTAADYIRRMQEMQDFMHQANNAFRSFGDFFNEGFSEAPLSDDSQRVSYFDKWFPQVANR